MNRRQVIILLVAVLLAGYSQAQKLNGNYVALNGGVIPKYATLTVEGDTATFEFFTIWQGAWMPAIGSWDSEYEPQYLIETAPNQYSNADVKVRIKAGRTSGLIGIARNTRAGRVKFKFNKEDRIPDKYLEIKNRVLRLNITQSTNYN